MSMIRNPVVYTSTPLRNRPVIGRNFSYALRDASNTSRMPGLPAITKTVTGSESASANTDPELYQYPDDNGNTNKVQWVAQEDEDDLFLDSVLTLVGMQAGEQIIVATDVAFVEHATSNGYLWTWGVNSTNSVYGLSITSGELPQFACRPKGGSSVSSQQLTASSGSTFAEFKGQGRFAVVLSLRVLTATTVQVDLRLKNASLAGSYTYASIDVRSGGTENPGISGGVSMANFVGLSIGSLGTVGGNANFWGRGATNVGRQDVIHGGRGTYDADRIDAVAEEMAITHRLDFPPSLIF